MPASSQRPNILLITTDQQRGDALGINGNRVLETPNLDAWADCGVNFRRGYVTCPICIPARRTLFSGQSPDSHGLRGYRDGLEWDPPGTFVGELSKAGYQTQLVGKMHLHPQGKRYGFDNIILSETSVFRTGSAWQKRNDYARWLRQQGIQEPPDLHGISGNGRLVRPWPLEERYHQNTWLAREAAKFLTEDRDPSCPFFLHLSFFHPHPPLIPPAEYLDRYLAKDVGGPNLGEWTPEFSDQDRPVRVPDAYVGPFEDAIIRRARAAYYALINHIDDCIAFVLGKLVEYGNPRANDPFYLLFSSDHGEMLGDYHLFRKALGYEASARVPFFVSGQNVPLQRTQTDTLVCWEDIGPTLLDLAGIEVPPYMDGRSLKPVITGQDAYSDREYIFGQCSEGPRHNLWITDERYKYLYFAHTREEQLFDLAADPTETRDLSGDAPDVLATMRERLARCLEGRDDLPFTPSENTPCGNQPPAVFWPAHQTASPTHQTTTR